MLVEATSYPRSPPESRVRLKKPVFSSLALFRKLIRTRDQKVGQPACELDTVGYFHLFITHMAILALSGGDLHPDRTTTFLCNPAILVTSISSHALRAL